MDCSARRVSIACCLPLSPARIVARVAGRMARAVARCRFRQRLAAFTAEEWGFTPNSLAIAYKRIHLCECCLYPLDHRVLEMIGDHYKEVRGKIHVAYDIEGGEIGRITMGHAMAPPDQLLIELVPKFLN